MKKKKNVFFEPSHKEKRKKKEKKGKEKEKTWKNEKM